MVSQHLYREHNFEFGQTILSLRNRIGLTQAGLAAFLGVSRRTIVDWEGGNKYPKAENLKQFIQLALQNKGFEPGQEATEIRTLWQASHVKVFLDEGWLASILAPNKTVVSKAIGADFKVIPYGAGLQKHRGELAPHSPSEMSPVQDWGESPSIRNFYGREWELSKLAEWLTSGDCRLAAILGMGGIGKTSLSVRLGQDLKEHFDFVLWRSMRSAPSFGEFMASALQFFSSQLLAAIPASPSAKISCLIDLMRQNRCLLILDNLETLLVEEGLAGNFRQGFADYATLLRRVAESDHQSCLVITSREKPSNLSDLEGASSPVRALRLRGLDRQEFQTILAGQGLQGDTGEWSSLIERYGGNPLALKMVSQTVRETFGRDIRSFLDTDTVGFGDVSNLLDSQLDRLTGLEKDLMFWLAIEREPVGLATLENNLYIQPGNRGNRRSLLEALESLRHRNLLETSTAGAEYTQQPVVMEYITELLIERVYGEIVSSPLCEGSQAAFPYLTGYTLMKAFTRDYIRQSQERLILRPLLDRLKGTQTGTRQVETYLCRTLENIRALPRELQGYVGGNVLNLLVALGAELQGWDFSGLNLWQANLSGIELHGVNLAGCDLSRTAFTEGFDYILALAYHPDGKRFASGEMGGSIKIWQAGERSEEAGYSFGLNFQGHSAPVSTLAYSPDGQYLASGSYDYTVRIWNASTGENLLVARGHTEPVRTVVFSPDGRLLVSGGLDGKICVWQVATGQLLATLDSQTGWIWTLAFSPDGQTLASGSFNDTISLWQLGNCVDPDLDMALQSEPVVTFTAQHGSVYGLTFNRDGHSLYSCGADGKIRVWSVPDPHLLQTLEGHNGAINVIAFSPDYSLLVSGGVDKTICLWQPGQPKPFKRLTGHNAPVVALDFNQTGTILTSSSNDRSLRFWSVQRGETLACLQGHIEASATVAVSPDGKSLAASAGNRVLIWPLGGPPQTHGQAVIPVLELKRHQQQILVTSFNPTGNQLATGGQDGLIHLWDLDNSQGTGQGRIRITLKSYAAGIYSLAFSPDGQKLANGDNEGKIQLWSVLTGQLLASLRGHEGTIWTLAFSPDGTTLVSGGNDGIIRLWDSESLEPKSQFGSKEAPSTTLVYHPTGNYLACAGFDGSIRVWPLKDNFEEPLRLTGHNGAVNSLAFQPAGGEEGTGPIRLLSGGDDGTVRLWEVEQKLEIARFQHGRYVQGIAFTRNGRAALSVGEGCLVKMWDIAGGSLLGSFRDFQPYEGVNIDGATGLSPTHRATLIGLGAVEDARPLLTI